MNKKNLSLPYLLWMVMFIIFPLLLIIFYAFTAKTDEGTVFSMQSFTRIFEPVYLKVLGRSMSLALKSTVICLLIGYPAAMILADRNFSKSNTYLILIVLPMWMNFLLRTYAWLSLLENNGLINQFFESVGLPRMQLMYNEGGIILGMVYNFLPFMILPIYSVICKIDRSVVEAAQDLGGNWLTVFRKVILPLSMPGVLSGITMVFMPAASTFVISRLLGGGKISLVGNVIEQQFMVTGDWSFGSALSLFLMVLIMISMMIINKSGERGYEGGGLY
jgi:spermidine/putrescine transport system permease protein